jgi:hypothetical protein
MAVLLYSCGFWEDLHQKIQFCDDPGIVRGQVVWIQTGRYRSKLHKSILARDEEAQPIDFLLGKVSRSSSQDVQLARLCCEQSHTELPQEALSVRVRASGRLREPQLHPYICKVRTSERVDSRGGAVERAVFVHLSVFGVRLINLRVPIKGSMSHLSSSSPLSIW